ncbi:hypothetical protein SM12BL3_38400 [Serratia marcescens]|nr:hypothetical protein SM12BL3_38400 [Serratia marcescens]
MATVNLGLTLPPRRYKHISEFIVHDIFANLPYKTGMVGAYFLSSQTVSPLVNYANLSKPLTRHGNPIAGPKYATLDHNNYYDTGLPSTSTLAVIGISLPIASTTQQSGVILSNYHKDESTSNLAQGDTLRVFADGGNVRLTQYGDFAQSSPPAANIVTTDMPTGQLIISYGLIRPVTTNSVGIGYYSPVNDSNFSAFNPGTVPDTRRIETEHTLRIGTTVSDTEFLGPSAVSVVLVFDQDIGGPGVVANERWLKGSFGPQFGLWS